MKSTKNPSTYEASDNKTSQIRTFPIDGVDFSGVGIDEGKQNIDIGQIYSEKNIHKYHDRFDLLRAYQS